MAMAINPMRRIRTIKTNMTKATMISTKTITVVNSKTTNSTTEVPVITTRRMLMLEIIIDSAHVQ